MVIDMKMSEEEMENLFENIWIKRLDMNEIVEASERDWIGTYIDSQRVNSPWWCGPCTPPTRVFLCVCVLVSSGVEWRVSASVGRWSLCVHRSLVIFPF